MGIHYYSYLRNLGSLKKNPEKNRVRAGFESIHVLTITGHGFECTQQKCE